MCGWGLLTELATNHRPAGESTMAVPLDPDARFIPMVISELWVVVKTCLIQPDSLHAKQGTRHRPTT